MNNNNEIIICRKKYQIRSNHLSALTKKINGSEKDFSRRISSFMLGPKKGQVVLNGRVLFLGTYEETVNYLTNY